MTLYLHFLLDYNLWKEVCPEWQHGELSQRALPCHQAGSRPCCLCAFGRRSFIASFTCPKYVPAAQMNCSDSTYLFISAVTKWNVSRGGRRINSLGPIRANRNGCLIYIAIRLAVFIHHFRLFITPVKNSMQWISCDIKSQFFLKAGTGSKLKDC